MTESIDLGNFRSEGTRVFSGRERGESVRTALNLDAEDENPATVVVVIPEDTYSINTSFFLGLFGRSVRRLGSRDAFFGRYSFRCRPEILDDIEMAVQDALKDSEALEGTS